MKKATYNKGLASEFTVEYDPLAPCMTCGLPVVEASMGGTALCPWCDTGKDRQGNDMMYRPRLAADEELSLGKSNIVFDILHKATEEEYAQAVRELENV